MKLTATAVLGATLLLSFVTANYDYGAAWQVDYPQASLDYQTTHGITPTEYQFMLDDSVRYLGLTLTNTFDYPEPVWLQAHFLYTEAIKHKARMDGLDDMLIWLGWGPSVYGDYLYQQMGLFDFAIVEACSLFSWTNNPNDPEDVQVKYFATLLSDSLDAWIVDFKMGMGGTGFEDFMGDAVLEFAEGWLDVIDGYTRN